MNADTPPPFASANPVQVAAVKPEPSVHLTRLMLSLAGVVVVFDTCFWAVNGMGFSVAVFILVLAGIILVNRKRTAKRKMLALLLVLLIGGSFAAALETGITNVLVLVALIIALAGGTYFREVESLWGRWLSQVIALLFAPGRIFWLAGRLIEAAFGKGLGWTGGILGSCLLALPALVLALVFGSLLATGNAVFGAWTNSFFDWFWKELALYFNLGRIVLWLVVMSVVLPLLRPANISAWWWSWTQRLPRLPEMVPTRGAFFSSALILVVLNLLFLVANSADVLFLWSGKTLPNGVTYSGFVHQGTEALTWTVLLSAVVLVGIFQQSPQVAQRRELKALALFWIAQNLFLLMSVALRLKLYIEAYDMTVLRLSVIIFLAVVAVGFVLLTIKIVWDRSLSWLVGGCILAIFASFYITQFFDLGGWSANYNVAQWTKDPKRKLDIFYLQTLGPAGWPALRRAKDMGVVDNGGDSSPSHDLLGVSQIEEGSCPRSSFDELHWREFSLRAWWNRWALEEKPRN